MGEPDRPALGARWLGRAAAVVLAAAVLFVCYWRQSLTQPISSDGAANALQAWDMLHGNLLLHGWLLSDVSFYTTELPQYMVIEAVRGLGPEVVNLAAAMTYTLLVLLAGLLAKGDASGREGLARFLLAAGIVLAPQLSATSTLLQAPDHTGTAVALLVVWLVIDRARPHWLVPVAVCVMLAWIMAADSIVLLTGIVPIAVAAGARAVRALAKHAEPSWHELSLAAAAILAAVLGTLLPRSSGRRAGTRWPRCRGRSWASAACRGRHGWRSTPRSISSAPTWWPRIPRSRWPSRCCTWPGSPWRRGPCASRRCGSSALANCLSRRSRWRSW